MSQQKAVGTWQKAGSGNPPLIWTIKYLSVAVREAAKLTHPQYWHVADQIRELAREKEPSKCCTVAVAPVEDFWEVKEKGGPLGKINLRVFFFTDPLTKELIVLGVHKKEDEKQLRRSVIVRIQRRRRIYLAHKNEGEGGTP